MDSYAEYLAEKGGMANCGNGLGVMVTALSAIESVPAGWLFIPLEIATAKGVREALDHAKKGRMDWPRTDKGEKPR